MGITPAELSEIHPTLFHMAEPDTWESIEKNGLLSTSALLDRFCVEGAERMKIELSNRRSSVEIAHPQYGKVTIRDQIPMTDKALEKCLEDMTPAEWYRTLNGRVFFWTTSERLTRLFDARAYRGKRQTIITIDTKSFLEEYGEKVEVSPINSGSTIYKPQRRGSSTFLPLDRFPFDEWRKKRNSKLKAVVEVTVKKAVPNLRDFVLRVEHIRENEVLETLYEV